MVQFDDILTFWPVLGQIRRSNFVEFDDRILTFNSASNSKLFSVEFEFRPSLIGRELEQQSGASTTPKKTKKEELRRRPVSDSLVLFWYEFHELRISRITYVMSCILKRKEKKKE